MCTDDGNVPKCLLSEPTAAAPSEPAAAASEPSVLPNPVNVGQNVHVAAGHVRLGAALAERDNARQVELLVELVLADERGASVTL